MPDLARHDTAAQLKRMQRLIELSETLNSTLDHHRLLRNIIEAARELTGSEAASIMLADTQSDELRFEATTNIEAAQMEGLVIPVEGSLAGWVFTNRQPLLVPDTARDPRWNRTVDSKVQFVTRSVLGVPLVSRDKAIGVLQALNKHEGTFTDDDTDLMQTLAAQATVAIVNARLFQQSDLISEMVHEIRTPLSSIMATARLLQRPDLPEDKRAPLILTVQRETERLNTMASDFLDMARLESGRLRFKLEPFNLTELIHESVDVVRPQASARNVALVLHLDPALTTINSDRGKLKQVLLNLLTNAVKYNREHGIITVTAGPVGAGREVCVSVADTGKGIPPDALKLVFQKFYRVPDSEGYATGTGLGLSVAKKIVEVLGGEMKVESEVGVGSTFSFVLPLRQA
jgi:signal transduction histidine kinase